MDMKTGSGAVHIAAQKVASPVHSHNEWDPLEEIIVGRLEGSVIPSSHPVVTCNIRAWRRGDKRWRRVSATPS